MMIATPVKVIRFTEGFLYQKFYPHIHCFVITNSSRETVDAAYDKIRELDTIYAASGQHLQYLYALDNLTITPYMAMKIQKAVAITPDTLTESVAIVADSFLVTIVDRLIMPLLKWDIESETRFFHTDAEAFAWFTERRITIGH